MGKLKCPECGEDLALYVDVVCTHSKKIKNDGTLHKTMNYSIGGSVTGAPYLKCERYNCGFSYDVEHASGDKSIEEIDDWIAEHLEEIYQLS